MSQFLTPLDVELVGEEEGRSVWKLTSPLCYTSNYLGPIVVEAGQATDFASIPRLPFIYLAEADKGQKAATVHDALYRESPHRCDRATADKVLREALIAEGVSRATAQLWYWAVRLGGGGAWNPGPIGVGGSQIELPLP